jgi:hypothetical protein
VSAPETNGLRHWPTTAAGFIVFLHLHRLGHWIMHLSCIFSNGSDMSLKEGALPRARPSISPTPDWFMQRSYSVFCAPYFGFSNFGEWYSVVRHIFFIGMRVMIFDQISFCRRQTQPAFAESYYTTCSSHLRCKLHDLDPNSDNHF